MSDCLFCKIVERKIPATILHEDASTLAFADINPQAPTHILIIPKKHVSRPADIDAADEAEVGHLFTCAAALAAKRGLSDGYRLVMNNGADAGQSVFHIHLHLLSGRPFAWPPG